MAHNAKRWIRTYKGRVKRSNDLTKKDRLSGADTHRHRWSTLTTKPDCPQCRYIWKLFEPERQAMEAYRLWWKNQKDVTVFRGRPHSWVNGKFVWGSRVTPPWPLPVPQVDHESWLCYRCRDEERAAEKRWWGPFPGRRRNYTWANKYERRKYRRQQQHLMRHERYDDLGPRKKPYQD